MKFFAALASIAAGMTVVSAAAIDERGLFSPNPGYPLGNGICLTDQQAQFLVNQFITVLSSPDRKAATAAANNLVADNYMEYSDSIDILAGFPLGGPSFSGKAAFVGGVGGAQAVGTVKTLDIFHDCYNISWRWQITGLGLNKYPVKGINDMTVTSPLKGQLATTNLEFNSIAWGIDTGYACQDPTGKSL